MITIETLKEELEKIGYFTTEELIYDLYNALCIFSENEKNVGQDIYALCLEGPPGAGKTEFAKVYVKLATKLLNTEVEMVDYQCDATTGKTELFEDINISAAIRGDAENVNIPGKLIEAIKKVNLGKKVVLFIDEYDKAREETDAFLLQFLQSGKLNSTQHGDLEIEENYKSNLQVILCKNNMREELSGPLSRRIRIIRLDYMEPSIFYKVAYRNLIENKTDKVNDGLINLVSLMYNKAYDEKEKFDRLPSCSEMLIAIEDADRLMKKTNVPQKIIYNILIKNMFKSPDDIDTFESILSHVKNEDQSKLSALVSSMKVNNKQTTDTDLQNLIASNVLSKEKEKLTSKIEEIQKLIDEYTEKFKTMEQKRIEEIEEEKKRILLEKGKLISTTEDFKIVNNFDDEGAFIKRGQNIFNLSDEWTEIGSLLAPNLSHNFLIEKIIEFISDMDIKLYENGILLKEFESLNIIVFKDKDDKGIERYRFMSNYPVIPSIFLEDIKNFISLIIKTILIQVSFPKTKADYLVDYSFNLLVYNDIKLQFEEIQKDIYNVVLNKKVLTIDDMNEIEDLVSNLSCDNKTEAILVSNKMMEGKKLVL